MSDEALRPDGVIRVTKEMMNAMVSDVAEAKAELRFANGALQQAWVVTRYQGGKVSGMYREWRDVPSVTLPADQPALKSQEP
jgi:protein involved in temperature-dependent protein secretion